MLDCPSDRTRVPEVDFWPYYGKENNLSYGINEKLFGSLRSSADSVTPRKITTLKQLGMDIMLTELNNKMGTIYYSCWQAETSYKNRTTAFPMAFQNKDGTFNHNKSINFLFADGHTATIIFSDFLTNYRGNCDTASRNPYNTNIAYKVNY